MQHSFEVGHDLVLSDCEFAGNGKSHRSRCCSASSRGKERPFPLTADDNRCRQRASNHHGQCSFDHVLATYLRRSSCGVKPRASEKYFQEHVPEGQQGTVSFRTVFASPRSPARRSVHVALAHAALRCSSSLPRNRWNRTPKPAIDQGESAPHTCSSRTLRSSDPLRLSDDLSGIRTFAGPIQRTEIAGVASAPHLLSQAIGEATKIERSNWLRGTNWRVIGIG